MNVHEQNDYLKEEVRQLRESMVGKRVGFPFEWGLTIAEERVLNSLYTSPTYRRTTESLLIISKVKAEVNPKMIQVHIHRIRRKLNPRNIVILSVKGEGYEIPPRSVAIIREALA